jgi:hypothetical protein
MENKEEFYRQCHESVNETNKVLLRRLKDLQEFLELPEVAEFYEQWKLDNSQFGAGE